MIKKMFIYTFFMCLLLISLQSVSAANISVHPGQSIQSAVNSAANGDDITVYDNNQNPYTYKETITINKKINIKASGNVTIEAKTPDSTVFSISSSGAGSSIQNFTLSKSNYCIMISGANNCLISGNKITAASLVGIQFFGNINNSNVKGNIINGLNPTQGNGISFENGKSSYNNLTGNIIGNFLNGILFNDDSENNIVLNNQIGCTGQLGGVGIYTTDNSRSMQIIGNTVTGAEDGIAVQQLGTNTAVNYNISGNTVNDNKNGFWICISNSTISYNTAAQNTVCGMDITGRYNNILNNNAHNNGNCGIMLSGLTSTGYDYNIISGNTLIYNLAGINSASNYSNFTYNILDHNQQTGLIITGSNCNIIANSISYNDQTGLLITSIGNLVIGNKLEHNIQNGAIFSNCNAATFNLNSVVGNGNRLYCSDTSGIINAINNWWGSNNAPAAIRGFNISPWIVLNVKSSPSQIISGDTSIITAYLTQNSNGSDVSILYPGKYVPDGIIVNFYNDSLGSVNPQVNTTKNGAATSAFIGNSAGSSQVFAKVDSQNVSTVITIIDNSDTTLTMNNVTGYKGDHVDIVATLKNHQNTSLSGKTIKFTVNGILIGSAVTNLQGTAVLSYILTQNTGTYTLESEFIGDSKYNPSYSTGNLQINQIPTKIVVNPVTGCKGDIVNLTSALIDLHNNLPLNNINIVFTVNGDLLGTAVTNAQGIANLPYTITQNHITYLIVAEFLGEDKYKGSCNSTNLNIDEIPTVITLNPASGFRDDIVNLIATLKDNNNLLLNGKLIQFSLDGTIIGTSITNTQGIAVLPYKILKNSANYTILAEFEQNAGYLGSYDNNILQVNRMFTSLNLNSIIGFKGKVVNLIATLNDVNKNSLNNKIIQFSINGISLGSATTNIYGVANLPYTITQSTGIYTILAAFFGDSNYVNNNNCNQLEVDNTAPTASITVPGGLYNTSKTVVINKSELGTIYYTLNGVQPSTSSTKYIGSLVINSSKLLKYFVVDFAGNRSPIYSVTYIIDKVASRVSSSSPVHLQRGGTRGGTIIIKFNEKIKASIYFKKIAVKNLKTNKYVSISKIISGNILYIKTSRPRQAKSWYQISIPRYAIRDYAGNKMFVTYTFRFKTY